VTVVIMATVVIMTTAGPLVAYSKVFYGNVVADALLL
jgi:low affinity Fe/Cu permease